VLGERLAICRLPAGAPVALAAASTSIAGVLRTAAETSVVCAERVAPAGARVSPGWCALEVAGPFELTGAPGVLSSLARPLAEAGVSLFALSTFDTDYLLVPWTELAAARSALEAAGHVFLDDAAGAPR
jgi:hypothetical protein